MEALPFYSHAQFSEDSSLSPVNPNFNNNSPETARPEQDPLKKRRSDHYKSSCAATAAEPAFYFKNFNIDSVECLETLEGRSACPVCFKSRKFFCYTCYVPMEPLVGKIPHVKVRLIGPFD